MTFHRAQVYTWYSDRNFAIKGTRFSVRQKFDLNKRAFTKIQVAFEYNEAALRFPKD